MTHLYLGLAAAMTCLLANGAVVATQGREITGSVTINGKVISITHVYAFAVSNKAGKDQGVRLLFTTSPLSDDALGVLVFNGNSGPVSQMAIKGQLTAVYLSVIPEAISAATGPGTAKTGMSSSFYSNVFVADEGSASMAGYERLNLLKSEPGMLAGHVSMEARTFSPNMGNGATLQYDCSFSTKLRTRP